MGEYKWNESKYKCEGEDTARRGNWAIGTLTYRGKHDQFRANRFMAVSCESVGYHTGRASPSDRNQTTYSTWLFHVKITWNNYIIFVQTVSYNSVVECVSPITMPLTSYVKNKTLQ